MAGESISIELFDPLRNEEPLIKLHGTHFTGKDSARKRRSYVHWLLSNPLDRGIYLAAYVNGAFASFLGFMAREVVGCGQRYRAALAFGAMTLPEFGGRGLYKRLAHAGWDEARNRGFHFALGYTVQKYVLNMELRMGWKDLSSGPVMVLPLDSAAAFRAALPGFGTFGALTAPAGWLFKNIAQRRIRNAPQNECAVNSVSRFSPDYGAFTQSLQQAEVLTFSKDSRILEWLYLSQHNPFEYNILEARRAGQLVGFAVGRKMDLMGLDGYGILDLVTLPHEPQVMRVLAARLVEVALSHRPEVIGALVSSRQEAEAALRSLGFIYSRRSFSLIYRPTQEALPPVLADPSRWSHCWGNNDTV